MTDFTSPQLGRAYANYERLLLPFDVTVDFWRTYGVAPEEVIFAKPGMWLAGPVPVAPPTVEELPAPEVAIVDVPADWTPETTDHDEYWELERRKAAETTEAGAVEGPTRLL